MIHEFEMDGKKFNIHTFDFSYMTDHVAGAPAEHGSVGFLDIEVVMDASQDIDGKNFTNARTLLWQAAVSAPDKKPQEIRKKMKVTAKQSAGDEAGSRWFEFEGWVSSFQESSSGGPGSGNRETLRARIVIRPKAKNNEYTPKVG